jgi:LDH2 family malate/lactate/ureidoglycolate dehydrogenase
VILAADFAGIESHGLARLVRYDQEIKSGSVDIGAKCETVHESALSGTIDAHKAMGQLSGCAAMGAAICGAKKTGAYFAAVRNSNHYGIASYYTEMAAREGLIGISMTNTEAIMTPIYGKKAMLGTNALALAMPATPTPFSLDMSTTVVARGKIDIAAKNGERIPAAWAVDSEGEISTDAAEIIHNIVNKIGGGILPLGGSGTLYGGHKGFGLGIVVEIFTGILSGGLTSNYVNTDPANIGTCHSFIALDHGIFGDKAAIEAHLSRYLRELRDSPKARGCTRIFIPGEHRAALRETRRNGAIPVSQATLSELDKLAAAQGIEAVRRTTV